MNTLYSHKQQKIITILFFVWDTLIDKLIIKGTPDHWHQWKDNFKRIWKFKKGVECFPVGSSSPCNCLPNTAHFSCGTY